MSPIAHYFPYVYCVNLDRRTDRWERTLEILSPLGIAPERWSAVDAKTSVQAQPNSRLMASEVACTMSHIALLQSFVASGRDKCLVFEDDVDFFGHFESVFNNAVFYLPPVWDVFYLGANHVTAPIALSGTLGRPTKAYSTCAYAVTRAGAEYLLKGLDPHKAQVDIQFSAMNRGLHFCTRPNVCTQRPDFSDVQNGFQDHSNAFKKIF